MKKIVIALVGQPNVGKSHLANAISGSNLKIGNFAGVTVEKATARLSTEDFSIEFIDLPGLYSLEDFSADEEEVFIVTTNPEDFGTVRETLEDAGIEFLQASVKMIPDTYTEINEGDAKKFQKMLDLLEDDEDVQDVYHNAEFPEGWYE